MEFDWDEVKRRLVVEKHALDFVDVIEVFNGNHLILPAKNDMEIREVAVGISDEKLIAVIFTRRGEKVRLISARRARENERRAFRKLYH